MKFIALKTEDGALKGKLSFYCRMLKVSLQNLYKSLSYKDRHWKYQDLADAMKVIALLAARKNSKTQPDQKYLYQYIGFYVTI